MNKKILGFLMLVMLLALPALADNSKSAASQNDTAVDRNAEQVERQYPDKAPATEINKENNATTESKKLTPQEKAFEETMQMDSDAAKEALISGSNLFGATGLQNMVLETRFSLFGM